MKKILFLISSLLIVGCSSTDKLKEREDIIKNKEEITQDILKENKVITLDEAIKLSVERNLDLKTKEIEAQIAKIDKQISFGNFLPNISLTYSRTLLSEKLRANALDTGLEGMGDKLKPLAPKLAQVLGPQAVQGLASAMPTSFGARMMDKDTALFTVNAQLPIFVPSTWFLYSARSKGENISLLSKDLTEKMIKLKTIAQYYYILALESEENHLKSEVTLTEKLENNAKLALETGSILPWEAQRVEVFHEMKELGLKQNKRELQIARIGLLNTLDLYPFTEISLVRPDMNNMPEYTLDEAIYEALRASDLISIREEVEGVNKDLTKIAISNFLPQIVLTGGYISTDASVLANNNFFMGTIGGLFSIFNGFKNVNQYRKAREAQKIAYIKKEQEITRVIFETVNAYNQLNTSKEEMQIAMHNFVASEGMLRQKQLEKETGSITDWEYIQSLSEYEKSLSLKEKTQFKYRMSLATLEMLMGKSIFNKGENKNEKK